MAKTKKPVSEKSLGGHAIDGKSKSKFLKGKQILPGGIRKGIAASKLIEETFLAYNAARLREACQVFTQKMLEENVTVGMSLTGALTPAGIGRSCIIPMMRSGFVDWIISTGANLYHDAHFGLKKRLVQGNPNIDDRVLRKEGVIRIYDILFDYDVLLSTDAFFREIIQHEEFQKPMSTAEFHWLCGKFLAQREKALGIGQDSCVLTTAYRCDVPIYTSSPGDSSIGMNVAAMALRNSRLSFDVSRDVNETAALVYGAKKGFTGKKGKSGVLIMGGGSPKNFLLQTEPQIQEVLGLDEKGHDYFLQFTDARPDTGGLSGATPSEAVSWGKVDASQLPDTVVCYADTTLTFPLLTAYALDTHKPRQLKRLYQKRVGLYEKLQTHYLKRVQGVGYT